MQIGGIGSGTGGHGSSHYVTGCLHDHDIAKEQQGGMKISSAPVQSEAKTASVETASEGLSLIDRLREALSAGKSLWGRIWGAEAGAGGAAVNGSGGDNTAATAEQVMAQVADADLAERSSRTMPHTNPYFKAAEQPSPEKMGIFQKVRVKIKEIPGQLAKRFSGTLFGRSSLGAEQKSADSGRQRYKEDLRKRSRYREDGLEIDCVLTDDSYLLDSYDRKGEYSRLDTVLKQ